MLNMCESCVYHKEENGVDERYIVCMHPDRDCSFPETCPRTRIKDEHIRPEELTCNIDFVINNK